MPITMSVSRAASPDAAAKPETPATKASLFAKEAESSSLLKTTKEYYVLSGFFEAATKSATPVTVKSTNLLDDETSGDDILGAFFAMSDAVKTLAATASTLPQGSPIEIAVKDLSHELEATISSAIFSRKSTSDVCSSLRSSLTKFLNVLLAANSDVATEKEIKLLLTRVNENGNSPSDVRRLLQLIGVTTVVAKNVSAQNGIASTAAVMQHLNTITLLTNQFIQYLDNTSNAQKKEFNDAQKALQQQSATTQARIEQNAIRIQHGVIRDKEEDALERRQLVGVNS